MSSSIQLSVVVPVYNGEVFIRETIESVLRYSSGFRVECIVINDGSTDETEGILNSFRDKVKIISQPNSGESAAVNRGLHEASGKYVVIVSADDPILSPKLFLGVGDYFDEHPQVVAWYPDWVIIDSLGQVEKTIRLPEYKFQDLFTKNKVLPGPGTWFRRESASLISGRNLKWKYVGDYDFWLRLSRQGLLAHRPEVLAQWRRHSHSTSIAQRGSKMAQERIDVIEEFIATNSEFLGKKSISLARAHSYYLAARLGFFAREIKSRELFLAALRINPKVIFSIKPHEAVFMLTYPLSKKIFDFFGRIREKLV